MKTLKIKYLQDEKTSERYQALPLELDPREEEEETVRPCGDGPPPHPPPFPGGRGEAQDDPPGNGKIPESSL